MKYFIYVLLLLLTLDISACAEKPVAMLKFPDQLYKPAAKINTNINQKNNVSQNFSNSIQPLFHGNNLDKAKNGMQAVKEANQKAVMLPSSNNTFNSIIIFQYQAGDLYQIYTTPLNVTDITLQASEQIISVAAGDTMRWQVSKTVEGFGSNRIEHLLIKPLARDINTTLVIMTNFRTYHLLLKATQNTFMVAVKWQYDKEDMMLNNLADDIQNNSFDQSNNLQNLNFSYQLKLIHGSTPDWIPNAIFDDGNKTYIEFPLTMQSVPDLFIKQAGSDAIVNYRVVKNYYVIDQLIQGAELVSDNGKTIVEIVKK